MPPAVKRMGLKTRIAVQINNIVLAGFRTVLPVRGIARGISYDKFQPFFKNTIRKIVGSHRVIVRGHARA